MKREASTKGESPQAKKSDLDIISTGSSESASSIGYPQFSSTPVGEKLAERIYKPDLVESLERLFQVNMSKDVLVDAIMHASPEKNKVTIVGRPKLLGSSTKQMRHVTPYSFIDYAIRAALITPDNKLRYGYDSYIDDIVNIIQPLIRDKRGICILKDECDNFSEFIEENEISEVLKFVTITQEKKEKVYYLVYDNATIEKFDLSNELAGRNFSEEWKRKSKERFNKKFNKYINHGIKYLKSKISYQNQNDPDTITLVCEGIARIILTMFNQDKYVAFPTEGNSLFHAIRVYKKAEYAKNASSRNIEKQVLDKILEIKSHAEITEMIIQNGAAYYDLCIRIVDNEGPMVISVTNALHMLDDLVGKAITGRITKQQCSDYNAKSSSIKIHDKYSDDRHSQEITQNNLPDNFHLYAARYLYMVFDLKPLEKKVFAAIQKKDADTVTVYPFATGARTAQYSVQDGLEYRELEVNRATGYNNKVTFLSEMGSEKLKAILIKKILMHICYSLIPYIRLRTGCKTNYEQGEMRIDGKVQHEQEGMDKIFDSFIELVTQDYNRENNVSTKLELAWVESVKKEYKQVCHESCSDTSNVSSKPSQANYSSMFVS